MTFGILDFPHSICTNDFVYAIESMLDHELVICQHVLPENPSFKVLLLADKIQNNSLLKESILHYLAGGGRLLGIGNGVETLIEWNLLPGKLATNSLGRGLSKEVSVEVASTNSFLTCELDPRLDLLFSVSGERRRWDVGGLYAELCTSNRILFRYRNDAAGFIDVDVESDRIAGMINEYGNVAGVLFHPERAVDDEIGNTDGRGVFLSAIVSTTMAMV